MHFITGGAFNGKSAWVKETYSLNEGNCKWFSGYKNHPLTDHLPVRKRYLVISGMEQYSKVWLQTEDELTIYKNWQQKLTTWNEMEKEGQNIIIIGSDISKGIVPIDRGERLWRDVTGRIYQQTTAACERVDVIWYGISMNVKSHRK